MKAVCVGGPQDRKLITTGEPPKEYSPCHVDLGGEQIVFYVHSSITPQAAVYTVFSTYANVKGK